MKILIVDDDFMVRGLIKEYLKSYVSEFFEADNFFAALKWFSSPQKFDIIILDNHLPDGLGINLIKPALLKTPNIIMFTADAVEYEFREQALQLGAKNVLSKTSSHTRLQEKVERVYKTCINKKGSD